MFTIASKIKITSDTYATYRAFWYAECHVLVRRNFVCISPHIGKYKQRKKYENPCEAEKMLSTWRSLSEWITWRGTVGAAAKDSALTVTHYHSFIAARVLSAVVYMLNVLHTKENWILYS